MGERCRMQDRIVGRDRIDVGVVAEARHQQIAMGEHGALRPARGAAGVEEPGGIVRRAPHEVHAGVPEHALPVGIARDHDPREARQILLQRRHGLGEIGADEGETRAGMIEDVAELLAVQLGVDRHGEEPGMPDREERLEIFRPVGHGDGDALAGRHAGDGEQRSCQRPHAGGPLAIGQADAGAPGHGGSVGEGLAVLLDPAGDVHRQSSPRWVAWRTPPDLS